MKHQMLEHVHVLGKKITSSAVTRTEWGKQFLALSKNTKLQWMRENISLDFTTVPLS